MADTDPEIDQVAMKAAIKDVLVCSGVGKRGFEEYPAWGSQIVFGGLGPGFEEPISRNGAYGGSAGQANNRVAKHNGLVPNTTGSAGHYSPGVGARAGSGVQRGGKGGHRGQTAGSLSKAVCRKCSSSGAPLITRFVSVHLRRVSNAVSRAT